MKKFLFSTLLLLCLTLLFSCKIGNGDGDDPDTDVGSGSQDSSSTNGDSVGESSEKNVYIISATGSDASSYNTLAAALSSSSSPFIPIKATGDVPEGELCVILGELEGNSVSEASARRMRRVEKSDYLSARYNVYSDGAGTVAISFDRYSENYVTVSAAEDAIAAFATVADRAFKSKGTLASGEVDLVLKQQALDDAAVEAQWNEVFLEAGGDENARILTESLKDFYSIYGDNLIIWLADLYDPVSGGFYYSNSARDNDGYLPDIESTAQVLDNLRENGMFSYVQNDLQEALPEEFKQGIIRFIKERQNPNGYFYHPQWSVELANSLLSRRARDLTKGISALKALGASPTYDTPLGDKGDGLDAYGNPVSGAVPSSASMTGRLGYSSAAAVSKVIAASSVMVPSHLVSDVTFKAWLDTLDLNGDSYTIGNNISSQTPEIIGRDKVLRAQGANYLLSQILIDWLNDHCYASTGHWNDVADYEGTNGLLKISGCYNEIARSGLGVDASLPYPEAALKSSVAALTTEEFAATVCYTYNVWFNICNILDNVTFSNKEEGERLREETVAMLREFVIEDASYDGATLNAITISKLKTMQFLKDDSSFSFSPDHSAQTSQGMQVALPNVNEGDINGTNLCSTGIVSRMFVALGLSHPQIFTQADAMLFLRKIEEAGPIIKDEEIVYDTGNLGFDDLDIGDELPQIDNATDGQSSLSVDVDPENPGNKVLHFSKRNGSMTPARGQIDFQTTERKKNYNAFVLSTDIYIDYLDDVNFLSSYMYGYLGTKGEQFGYEFILSPNRRAELRYADTSHASKGYKSSTYETGIAENTWFNLKIEYYLGDAETVRIKIYLNNKLFYVSDNFYGPATSDRPETNHEPLSNLTTFRFATDKSFQGEIYFDNFNLYQANLTCQDHLIGTQEIMPDTVPTDTIDFEDTPIGNKSDKVIAESKNTSDYFSATVVTDPAGTSNKVLKNSKYNKLGDDSATAVSGYAGTLKFVPEETSGTYKTVEFSSDLYVDFKTSSTLIFRLGNHVDTGFMMFITRNSNGSLRFRILSNSTNPINEYFNPAGAFEEEWFNLKVEYYIGNADSVRIKVYVNGELIYVSQNFYGPMSTDAPDTAHTPLSRFSRAIFSSYGDYEGDVYFDNVSFKLTNRDCADDALGFYAHTCRDADENYRCDGCGQIIPHDHEDTANRDDICDKCGSNLPHSCYDGTGDYKCDKCQAVLPHECIDAIGHDDLCDICEKELPHSCYDGTGDYKCDKCQKIQPHECVDSDSNYHCDYCDKVLSHECTDTDGDYKCNICEKYIPHTHTDDDGDGKCDLCKRPFSTEDTWGNENLFPDGWTKP